MYFNQEEGTAPDDSCRVSPLHYCQEHSSHLKKWICNRHWKAGSNITHQAIPPTWQKTNNSSWWWDFGISSSTTKPRHNTSYLTTSFDISQIQEEHLFPQHRTLNILLSCDPIIFHLLWSRFHFVSHLVQQVRFDSCKLSPVHVLKILFTFSKSFSQWTSKIQQQHEKQS